MRKTLALLILAPLAWADEPKPTPKADPPKADTPKPEVKPRTPQVLPRAIVPAGAAKADRPADVKRAIDNYQTQCQRYVDSLFRAKDEEKAELVKKAPNPRLMVVSLTRIVAADPKDDAAFDALAAIAKYADVPAVQDVLKQQPGSPDPLALLLEHHLGSAKLADVAATLPPGEVADKFTNEVFAKTLNPEVKGKLGMKLATVAMAKDEAAAEKMLVSLAEDKYMSGVKASARQTVKEWAEANLREVRLLGVGKTLPDVKGEGLDGKTISIKDYRGKVVVLDVWATWCPPCRAMIPHEREMVKKLEGKPFALVSVSCDDEKDTLTKFLKDNDMPWQHWWVGRGGEFSKSLNIRFYPTIFVLDGKGTIRHKGLRGEKLEEAVVKLLEEVK